jgi:hypothetical protein
MDDHPQLLPTLYPLSPASLASSYIAFSFDPTYSMISKGSPDLVSWIHANTPVSVLRFAFHLAIE